MPRALTEPLLLPPASRSPVPLTRLPVYGRQGLRNKLARPGLQGPLTQSRRGESAQARRGAVDGREVIRLRSPVA